MNKVIIQENMRFLTALRLCLFGCKIFLDVKYFTMKIFYKNIFILQCLVVYLKIHMQVSVSW